MRRHLAHRSAGDGAGAVRAHDTRARVCWYLHRFRNTTKKGEKLSRYDDLLVSLAVRHGVHEAEFDPGAAVVQRFGGSRGLKVLSSTELHVPSGTDNRLASACNWMSLGCELEHEIYAVQQFFESPHGHFRPHSGDACAFLVAVSPKMMVQRSAASSHESLVRCSSWAHENGMATYRNRSSEDLVGEGTRGDELCRSSSIALQDVSERLHLAVPHASLAVPSATQAKGALDSRDMSLPTPRGSVVDMIRRTAFNDEDLAKVADLSTALGSMRPTRDHSRLGGDGS